mmetsp:Transcript_43845/g.93315  ORF Transcript_43845/g.93315 Transcript_43845/m.93315 type:complete len:249 (-) Transcript_43845:208-954(-)
MARFSAVPTPFASSRETPTVSAPAKLAFASRAWLRLTFWRSELWKLAPSKSHSIICAPLKNASFIWALRKLALFKLAFTIEHWTQKRFSMFASVKSAPSMMAPCRLAPRISAPLTMAIAMFAPWKETPERSAISREAPSKLASAKLADLNCMPESMQPRRSAFCKSTGPPIALRSARQIWLWQRSVPQSNDTWCTTSRRPRQSLRASAVSLMWQLAPCSLGKDCDTLSWCCRHLAIAPLLPVCKYSTA